MIRKILLLCAVLLSATTSFAQQDTIVNPLPEDLATESTVSDSVNYQDTVFIVHEHHHGHRPHFQGYKAMHEKAVKRRHKMKQKEARENRRERAVTAQKRAKARTAAHRHSNHSSHSSHSNHHSSSHRSGHSRGRR